MDVIAPSGSFQEEHIIPEPPLSFYYENERMA